jgi:hypothetical protein
LKPFHFDWRSLKLAVADLFLVSLYTHLMKTSSQISFVILFLAFSLFNIQQVAAHCDTLDGPVVATAKLALNKGDVTPILKWVNKESEKEIREAFALTMKVRSEGEDARRLADTHLFETVVRLHRAGEGEPFTGLKAPGTIDPGFQVADKALAEGSVDKLAEEITKSTQEGMRKRFAEVIEKRNHAEDSIEAGRAYVAAYIEYAHFVEAIHTILSSGATEHHHLHASNNRAKQNTARPSLAMQPTQHFVDAH